MVEQEDQIDRIRSFFDIENFITFDQQEKHEHFKIVRCSMAPGFHALTRMVLAETMRLSNCITLYQAELINSFTDFSVKNRFFLLEIEILVKTQKFSKNSNSRNRIVWEKIDFILGKIDFILGKIDFFVRNRNFGKNRFLFVRNRNFGKKSKFLLEIDIFVKKVDLF